MKIKPVNFLQKFEIIGHRGNPGNPLNSRNIENTIPSFKAAFEAGADGIELDVIPSRQILGAVNSTLMVHHDDYPGRVFINVIKENNKKLFSEIDCFNLCVGSVLNIEGLTKELLKKGSSLTSNLGGVHIPYLFEVSIPKRKKIFLELKFPGNKLPEDKNYLKDITKKAVEYVVNNNSFDNAYVLSFVPEALDEVKNLNYKIVTAYNVYSKEANKLNKIKQLKKDYGFDIMNPPFRQASKKAIENIHSEGLKTYPWVWKENAKKEIAEVRRLFLEGADGVITNQVEEALDATFDFYAT